MNAAKSGEWAVAVRDAETGKGFFVHNAMHVTEQEARKAFGLAIRAGEYDLPVRVDENDTVKITAVRLLQWDYEVIAIDNGDALIDAEGGWKVAQEHSCGVIRQWDEMVMVGASRIERMPYREDSFHPGVPCRPGAWGSSTSCAMHWGLPLDEEHGMCAEGKRGAKLLGLVLVPRMVQDLFLLNATMTNAEVALVVADMRRILTNNTHDKSVLFLIEEACTTFERAVAQSSQPNVIAEYHDDKCSSCDARRGDAPIVEGKCSKCGSPSIQTRSVVMMNHEGDASCEPGKEG